MKNLGIVGSRTFTDYEMLKDVILECIDITEIDKIISGGAKGADTLAEIFAKEFNKELVVFKADWNQYGKSAGYRRNIDIVENSSIIFAFHVNGSKGTQHTIDLAEKRNIPVYTLRVTRS